MISTASSIDDASAGELQTVQFFAMGKHKTRNGTPEYYHIVDLAHAQAVVDATLAHWHGADVMIDYDHQAITAPKNGGRAAAAGWVKKLYATAQGIFADVEWTANAAAAVEAKEYRYISPASRVDAQTGHVKLIVNAALTNTPNLDLLAVASALGGDADQYQKDDLMDKEYMKKMAMAMGLPETASADDIMKCIEKDQAKLKEMKAMASILSVDFDADDGVFVAAATAAVKKGDATPDPKKFVPMQAFDKVTTELASLAAKVEGFGGDKRKAMIDAAGDRLPPALRDFAESLDDDVVLASFLDRFPANGLGKQTASGDAAAREGGDGLSEDELQMASSFGLTPEEFKKSRDQQENGQ